ncbi:MAG: hypothetical protein WBB82_02335 [Limnothrix sp.]
MQKISTTLSPALDQAENAWDFVEVWIDPMLFPPNVLLVLRHSSGSYCVYDPAKENQLIFSSKTYEEVRDWLAEDEYEPIEGRLLASEL